MSAIKQFPFTPILGWSNSRYDLFSICKRRYFYHYYAKYDHEFSTKDLLRYKNLVSIPLAIGSIVHEVIEAMLNRLKATVEPIDRDRFFDYAVQRVDETIAKEVFEEVVYGEFETLARGLLYPKVELCLLNLLESDRYAWLVSEAVEYADGWIVDPPGYGESRLGDLKIYAKVDFLFPLGASYHILDWKSGKVDQEKHRKQLIAYATWAAYHFNIQPEKVQPTVAYLHPEYLEIDEAFSTADLENFAIQVLAETEEMYEYCRDVANNIPLDKLEFARVDHERICAYCNFRGVCFPDEYQARY